MPIPPDHGTYSVPKLGLGNSASFIKPGFIVGNSLDEPIAWLLPDPDDCDGPKIPADFEGYIPVAEIHDASGSVVETLTVVPAVGDDTGIFNISLTGGVGGQTTQALADVAVEWRFRITQAPSFDSTLIIAPFRLRA